MIYRGTRKDSLIGKKKNVSRLISNLRGAHDHVLFSLLSFYNAAFQLCNILFAGHMWRADITPLTYLNCKHVPFTVSCTVAHAGPAMKSVKKT